MAMDGGDVISLLNISSQENSVSLTFSIVSTQVMPL
jgi:hypothetical protein